MVTKFAAADQALGYLYQARYALWLLLDGKEDRELTIEGLDDIVFEDVGNPTELLQLKHHRKPASLTDSSPDLWKTLRIWSDHVAKGRVDMHSTTLTLVTTGIAPDGSIAGKLHPNENRDSDSALRSLVNVALTSHNTSLQDAFNAFIGLSQGDQKVLVDSVYILDRSPDIQDVTILIKDKIKSTVHRSHRESLYERLEGWWFAKVVNHLASHALNPIIGSEVYDMISFLAAQFGPDALPIDFLEKKPNSIDAQNDTRFFVQQLKAIAIQNRRIEKAIIDYYRAFEQRSKWAREDLLIGDELEQYENKLIDEWERFSLAIADNGVSEALGESDLQEIGRHVYDWTQQTADYKLRPNVTEPYVMRGTYHLLADRNPPRVWWHPKFLERLEFILNKQVVSE